MVGFVVNTSPNLKQEIKDRVAEIEELHEVKVVIQSFQDWVKTQAARAPSLAGHVLGARWIIAFAECLTQQRRDRAPIDEPADAWVVFLTTYAAGWKKAR